MSADAVLQMAVVVTVLAPALLLLALGVPSFLRRPLSEAWIGGATRLSSLATFLASALALGLHLASGGGARVFSLGAWFSLGHAGFAFDFLVDGLSLGFAVLSSAICGVVAAFSFRYLHREHGFNRYFIQFALFVLSITLVALAGSIEVLFVGWELVGISSALLVGFFHERRAPVANALRIFGIYRVSDAAMLGAAVLLHHWAGSGSLSRLFLGAETAAAGLTARQAVVISVLLILAVAGKSALLPFSGWLPRAMEGPTPSSAVYYGALSIHAGCFLLLRAEPLLSQSLAARVLAALAGLTTAVYATLTARVQTDVKSALSYGSLTQVGMIVVEISVGLTGLAFVHLVGHACFRLLQFLSAPNVLHDLHELEGRTAGRFRAGARSVQPRWLYLAALERGFVDSLVDRTVVFPFQRLARGLDRFDRLLCGEWKR